MATTHKTYGKGDLIFQEGDRAESMYLVKSGSVSIQKRRGETMIEIAQLRKNAVVGELAFFDRGPRSATAIASTDCELIELDFKSLDRMYAKVPNYIKAIMVAVADRLRKADDMIQNLHPDPLREKV